MEEWIDGADDFEHAQKNVFEKARELTSFLELHCNTFGEKSGLSSLSNELKEKMAKVNVSSPKSLESIKPETVSNIDLLKITFSLVFGLFYNFIS